MESKSNIIPIVSSPPEPHPHPSSHSLNLVLTMENIAYRNNKSCFIKDDLPWCLENNIISEEISHHKIWTELNIPMIDYDTLIEMKIPYHPLVGDWITEYWDFKLVKVTLEPGWKLSACEFDKVLTGKFIIMKNDEPQSELLDFFTIH